MDWINKMWKAFGRLAVSGTIFLIKGHVHNKKTGAQFLDKGEIAEFLSKKNTGLLLDGESLRLSEKESFQNVLYAARVGAGKTTKYIIPNVLDKADMKCSIVVHDPKGEVFELTSGFMKSKGFNIVVFNPNDLTNSNYFNPLLEAKSDVELEQIAETIIWSGNPSEGDKYWNNGATRIISVLIKVLALGDKKYFNLPNIHHLFQNFGVCGEGLDDFMATHAWNPKYPNDPYLINEWKGALTGNKEAIQSFVGICLTSLKLLSNREIRQFFSNSDYDLSTMRKEKTVIYFITPPDQQQYYSFATSLFFRAIFNACMKKEALSKNTMPIYCLYDEFGNSYVTDFVSVANTLRGYKVSLSIILQSISQLESKYGKATASAIHGAFNTNVCLDSSDPSTAEHFSLLSGRVRETQLRSHHANSRDSFGNMLDQNTEYREFNLLNSNEVRTLESDETLIISRNRNPVKIKITSYFENRKFRKMSSFPPEYVQSKKYAHVPLVEII
jgi:type IV secretion system protein VirD4